MDTPQDLARPTLPAAASAPMLPDRFGPGDPMPWRPAATILLTAVAMRAAVRASGNAPTGLISAFDDVIDWCGSTGRPKGPIPVPGPTGPDVPWWWKARLGQEVIEQAMTLPNATLRQEGFKAAERLVAEAGRG